MLLMRLVVGSAVVARASLKLLDNRSAMNVTIPSILLIAAAILLIAGLWTPIAGTFMALTESWKLLMLPGDKWLWLVFAAVGAALAMLGPGLWSVDARLYGWKRLEPTPRRKAIDLRKDIQQD